MLTAGGRLEGGAAPAMRPAAVALGVSVLLHGLVAAALLVRVARPMPAEPPPIEVELVQQQAEVRGAPAAAPAAPAAQKPTPAVPERAGGDMRVAPLLPPAAPLPRSPPAAPAPEINLGSGPQDVDPLNVTSKDVVPPAPDSRYRNLPPRYPPEAAQVGGEGVVQLLIHVTAAGLPSEVVVAHSSGFEALDQEARRAVLLWRFRPARNAGRAVPFDYLLNIRFSLGDRD